MRKWIYDWTKGNWALCVMFALLILVSITFVTILALAFVDEPMVALSLIGFFAAIGGIAWILKLAGKP